MTDPAYSGAPIEPAALNVALLAALGLDPDDDIGGARVTIQAGHFPTLEVWRLPPHRDGELLDTWIEPLTTVATAATFVMLPGSDSQAPPAQARQPVVPFTADRQREAELIAVLTQMADALNGAYVDNDTRDRLTQQARAHAQRVESSLYDTPEQEGPSDG